MISRYMPSVKNTFFITTPIYYVNASPHIGHLYSSLLADAAHRWQQLVNSRGKSVFSTGTDEHGSKVQQAAAKGGITASDYCSFVSGKYRSLVDAFDVGCTDFIRTSEQRHKAAVQSFWETIDRNGHIYSDKYAGWYCVPDENFLTASQLKEVEVSGKGKVLVSADSGHPVEWVEEQNYIFRLSAFQSDLIHWLRTNEHAVRPAVFHKILLDQLASGNPLPDVSISRPSSRVHWGIRVPGDDTQTVYVWLDALVNYLTAAGYPGEFREAWPPDVHVIGKDILKFHGVYWPAFLMAADLEPPRSILCHSHWTVDGEKMSKSKNNVVCPVNRSQVYTADGFRYFLLREGVPHSDGNYSDTKVTRIVNSELADTLGNLLSRCTGTVLNPSQVFPQIERAALSEVASEDTGAALIESVEALPDICREHYESFNFYRVADSVMATLHRANLFFETTKPWELKKKPDSAEKLNTVLHLSLETLRISALMLHPLIPNISRRLLDKLGVAEEQRNFESAKIVSWKDADFKERKLSPEKVVLFRRIDDKERRTQKA